MQKQNLEKEKWVDPKQASSLFPFAEQTLANWRFQKKGPAYYKFGRAVRYRIGDLLDFMEAGRINPEC